MKTAREQQLEEALRICSDALEIAGDWHAPYAYDIKVPKSWDSTKDADHDEPDWPTGNGIVDKCREILGEAS